MRTRSSACDVGSDVTSDSQLRDVSLCIVGERVATPAPLPPPSSSHGDTTAAAATGGVCIGSSSGGRRLTSSRGGLVARSSLRLGSAGGSGKQQQQEQQQQQQRVRDDDATVTAAAAVVAEVSAASPLSLRRQQRRAQATTTGSDNVLAHAPAMAATATATPQSAQSPTASPAPTLPPLPARDAATPVPHARVDGSDTTMTMQPQHTAATPTSVMTATVSRMPCVPRLRGTCNAAADVVHTDGRVEAHAVAASPATTTATATATTTTTTTLPLQHSPSLPPLPRQPRDARKDDGDSGATMHDDAMTRATNAFLTAVPLSHTRTLAARQAQPPPPRQTTTTTTTQQPRQVESRSNGSEAATATTTTAPPLPTMSEVRALRQSQRAAARRPLHANAASLHAIALPTLVLDDATATSSLSQTQEQQQQQLPPRGQSVYAVFQHLLERERGAMHSALSGLDFTRFMWSSAEASRLIVVFFWFTVAQCRRGWLERLLMVRYERLLAAYQELYRHGHKERLPPLRVLDELVAELLYITPRWQALCAASQQQQQQQQQAATTARGDRSSSSSERGRDYAMQLHHLVRDSRVCHTLVHMSRVYNNGSSCSSGGGAAVAAAAAAALLPDVRVVEALCRALDAFVCACDEHAQVVQYTERAFARMATLYGGIFVSLARDVKDVTLRSYAHAVVRITYYTLLLSFPGDAHASGLQQASFRADVYRLYHYWCAGLTETHVPTRHWPTPQACDYAERVPPLTRHTLSGNNSSSTATAAASAGGSGTSVPATTAAAAASSLTSNDALHGVVASLTAARRGYFALHLTPQQLQQQRRVSIDVIASIVAPMTMTDNNNNTTATTAAVTGRGCGGPASPVVPDRVWRSRRGSTVVGAEAAAQQYEAQQQRTCRVVTTTAAAAAAAVTAAMSPLALRSSATTPRLAHAAHYGSGSSSSAGGRRVTDMAATGLSLRGGGGSSSIGSCSLTTTTSAVAAAAAASAAALSTAVVADEEAALLAASTAAAAAQAGDAYNYGANFARYVRHSTRLLHELDKRVAREHKKHLRRGRGTQRFTTTDAHNGGGATTTTTTAMTMAHTSMQRRASFAQPETPLHVFAVLRDAVGGTPRAMSLAGSAATRRSSVGVAATTTTMMAMASSTANVASNVVHAAPGRRLSMHSMQSSVCSEDNNNNTANNAAGSNSTTRGCTVRASDSMTDKTAQQHHSHRYPHNSSNNYGHSIMVGSMAVAAGGGSGVCDGDEDNREDVDKDVALLTARRRRVLHDVDVRRSKLATTHTVAPLTDLRTLLQPEHEQQQQQQQGKAHKATTTTTTSHADAPASDNDEDNNSSDGGGHNSNNSHHDNGAQAAAAAAAAAQYVNTSLLLSFPLALCESGVRAYVCCVAGVRLPDVPLPSTIATLLQQMQSHAPALITTPPATTTTTATATATTMHDGSVPQHHHAQQQQQLPHHHHHHRHSDDDIVAEEAMRRAEAWADEVAAAVTRTLSKAQQVQRTRLPASSPFVHYYATHVLHVHVQDEGATSHEQASTQQQQDETAAVDAATTSTPRPTHCRGVRHAVAPRTHVMTIPRCDGVARPRRFARLTAEALQQQHALLDDVHRITARDRLSRHAYNVAHLRTAHTVHAVQSTAYTQRYRRWARHALALQPLQHTTATAGAAVADGHSGSSDTSSHDAEDAQMQQGNKNNTARRSDALVVGGGGVNGSSGSRFSPLLHSLAHNV